jgi:hypothetical protein
VFEVIPEQLILKAALAAAGRAVTPMAERSSRDGEFTSAKGASCDHLRQPCSTLRASAIEENARPDR